MNSQAPNAREKRFREAVRGMGSIVSGQPAVIHHVAGRTAKHNKIALGHWWILPLTDVEHRLLHSNIAEFERVAFGVALVGRWDSQKILFHRVLQQILDPELLPPWEVHKAITEYQR